MSFPSVRFCFKSSMSIDTSSTVVSRWSFTAFRPDRHDTKPWSWRPQWHSNVPKDKHGTRPEAGRWCFFSPGISGWVTWGGTPTQPVVGKIWLGFFLPKQKKIKQRYKDQTWHFSFFNSVFDSTTAKISQSCML